MINSKEELNRLLEDVEEDDEEDDDDETPAFENTQIQQKSTKYVSSRRQAKAEQVAKQINL